MSNEETKRFWEMYARMRERSEHIISVPPAPLLRSAGRKRKPFLTAADLVLLREMRIKL